MAKRMSNMLPLVLGALALLIVVMVILASIPRLPLPTGGGIFGHRLTEEVQPPQVLYASTIAVKPGEVYQVKYDVNGISVVKKSSQLVERLNLSNIDLSVGDVVAPHLYDWYFDGVDDYIKFEESNVYLPDALSVVVDSVWDFENVRGFVSSASTFLDVGYSTNWMLYNNQPYWGVNDLAWLNYFNTPEGEGLVFLWYHGIPHGERHIFAMSRTTDGVVEFWLDGQPYTAGSIEVNNGTDYVSSHVSSLDLKNYGFQSWNQTETAPLYIGQKIHGPIGYVVIANVAYNDNDVINAMDGEPRSPAFLADPTFFNGTHYFDLVNNIVGTPYGGVARIPAEHPWLWLVKGLASDNKLHLKYVPPGSIFRIHYNGMVYEWRIDGTPDAAGLVEDYPIDIAGIFGQTVLPNATVELIYPSQKVRFYVPSGFQVEIDGNGWSETHEVPLNSSYVDFGLPSSGTYTIKVLGYEEQPNIRVETSGDVVRFVVTDQNGYALAGAKIYIYDGGNLVAVGTVNDLGYYEINKTRLSGDQVRVVVVHLKDGKYYHADKLVSLSAGNIELPQPRQVEQAAQAVQSNHSSSLAFIVIFLLLLAVIIVAVRKR